MSAAVLLATLETKREEAEFLRTALENRNVETRVIDVSLRSKGEVWKSVDKMKSIETVVSETVVTLQRTVASIGKDDAGYWAVLGLGGGTGGEIVLRVMQTLPMLLPKLLITTLPFDVRPHLADNSIIILPTLTDIAGLNPVLRQAFEQAAGMIAGLRSMPVKTEFNAPSIGLTTLGITQALASGVVKRLRAIGEETTVFHANGYGGAAYARFARNGAFKAVVDITVHELNRLLFAGDCVKMPCRFTAAAHIPQIVLPGGLNFLGLGQIETISKSLLKRPHYSHSKMFTHVKVTPAEMERSASVLASHLNQSEGGARVIVPMGGFSHQDGSGGEIEDPELRHICLEILKREARYFEVEAFPYHINDPETSVRIVKILQSYL